MASTFSTNLSLELQGTGDNSGTWGSVLNTSALNIVDSAMGGVQTLSLSGGSVTVNTAQSQNNAFLLTGALPSDVNVTFPAIGRTYFIVNNTTGAFSVTLKAGTGATPQIIPQGGAGYYTLNVNDVLVPTLPGVPTGAIMAFAMTTLQFGWMECNGAAISRTTYAGLFALIGTTYGAGDGVTTFNLPDLRGYFPRGWDNGRGIDPGRTFGSSQSDAFRSHNHTFSGNALPPHNHYYVFTDDVNSPPGSNPSSSNSPNNATAYYSSAVSAGTPTGSISSTGGSETRPFNVAIMYCIKVI
jgi:microcystin-dependent protein